MCSYCVCLCMCVCVCVASVFEYVKEQADPLKPRFRLRYRHALSTAGGGACASGVPCSAFSLMSSTCSPVPCPTPFFCTAVVAVPVNTYGDSAFSFLPWSVATESSIVFNVSVCSTSCFYNILLSSSPAYPDPTAQTYLISISASAGSTTAAIYPPVGAVAGALKSSRTFWVSWAKGTISVGVGRVAGQGTTIVSYNNPPLTPVNCVAFSSSGAPVSYLVYVPGLGRTVLGLPFHTRITQEGNHAGTAHGFDSFVVFVVFVYTFASPICGIDWDVSVW